MHEKTILISAMELIIASLHDETAYCIWWQYASGYYKNKKPIYKTPEQTAADENTFRKLTALFPFILACSGKKGFEIDGKLYPEGRELKENEI